ncbi:hypothetical protein MLD38_035508 [Melastoma candidum]|uniref:Uncharacterized protein n=1 Tax=Melastoma candidum TaxID=119954 RepID=A0ACB9LH15_9MYRT|nr:hypothetical protein MLD38_035508 [Melastoma candidum]
MSQKNLESGLGQTWYIFVLLGSTSPHLYVPFIPMQHGSKGLLNVEFPSATVKESWRFMTVKVDVPVSLLRRAMDPARRLLWVWTKGLMKSLHFLGERKLVKLGRHPNGGRLDTATFSIPKPWILLMFIVSWLTTLWINAGKACRGKCRNVDMMGLGSNKKKPT